MLVISLNSRQSPNNKQHLLSYTSQKYLSTYYAKKEILINDNLITMDKKKLFLSVDTLYPYTL